jgi:hypothetical protein
MDVDESPINLRYTLNRDDYVRFALAKRASEQLWPAWRQRVLVFVGSVSTSVLTCMMASEVTSTSLLCTIVVGLIFTVALTAKSPWSADSLRRACERFYDRHRSAGLCEPQELDVTTGGLAHRWTSLQLTSNWNAVFEVGVVGDYAFVTLVGTGAIVPRRAFADEGSFRAFVARIARYHADASPSNAIAPKVTHGFPVVRS